MYYRTSREMLWHLRMKMERFAKRDDLGNATRAELVEHFIEIYDLIVEQLEKSEE